MHHFLITNPRYVLSIYPQSQGAVILDCMDNCNRQGNLPVLSHNMTNYEWILQNGCQTPAASSESKAINPTEERISRFQRIFRAGTRTLLMSVLFICL
eukprot:Gb_24044 [translate_table: standard]